MGRSRTRVLTLAIGALVVLVGCRRDDAPPRADPLLEVFQRQAQEEELTRLETSGKRLFVHYCVTCHGDGGAGDGQNAYNLDPQPPNFRESLGSHPPSYWRQIIEGGSIAVGRSALCPPWGRTINGQDIDALVAYLEALSRRSQSSSSL